METSGLTEPEVVANPYAPPEGKSVPTPMEWNPGRERALLLILATVQLANIMDFMIVMPLGPILKRSLSITADQFGMIVASYTFSASVAGLLAALIIDRFDRKSALLTLVAGFTIGTFSCGFAPSYNVLVLARIVTGAFGGVLGALIFAIIGDVFPDSRRGMATGTVMAAFSLASVAGVPFGLFLGSKYGWESPFYLLGGLGALVGIAAFLTMPSLRGHIEQARGRNPAREVFGLLTHPNHLRAFALTISMMFGSFAVIPFISMALVDNSGVREDQLLWLYTLGGACTLVSSPLVGRLADKIGKLRVYLLMAVLSLIPFLLVTNLPRVPLIVAMLVVAALMICNSGRMIPAMAMITGSVEPSRRGGFMSVNASVQHFAAGLAAAVASMILGASGVVTPGRFRIVGLLSGAAVLVSLPLAARLRPAAKPSAASDVDFAGEIA